MRVFLTGVSAYAGFYAALRFAAAGHQVSGLARDPAQPRLDLLRMREIAIVQGDIADPPSYAELLERSDVVVHTMLDKRNPLATDRAMFATIGALPRRPGAPRRFIYTTGCSMFGKVGIPIMDETTEPDPAHPLAFRRTLEREALALDAGTVVFRPGFMYGNDGFNSMSADWFAMAEAGEAEFRGDREKGWSWVHVDDLAEAYLLAAEAGRAIDGEAFGIADEQRPRSLDVMRRCLEVAGYRGEIAFGPPKAGDNVSTWFDQNEFVTSQKARRLLGWAPRHTGILDSVPAVYAAWKAAQHLGARLAR